VVVEGVGGPSRVSLRKNPKTKRLPSPLQSSPQFEFEETSDCFSSQWQDCLSFLVSFLSRSKWLIVCLLAFCGMPLAGVETET